VESFLAQFETHSKYFQWKEEDRVFQLKNSLTGIAAQTIWTGDEKATSAELIQLLHSRHCGKSQTQRFWAELRAQQRKKDEPLQELCQDIRRLMYLASPHETGPFAEHLRIDLYVAALGDPNMQMFVLTKDPATLEDAYGFSTQYEALLLGTPKQTGQQATLDSASYVYDDKGRRKENTRAVEVHPDIIQRDLEKRLAEYKNNWRRGRYGVMSLHGPRPHNRPCSTTGGRPDTPAAGDRRPIPDLTPTLPEVRGQDADAAPILPHIAIHKATRVPTITRIHATTAAARVTLCASVYNLSDAEDRWCIGSPHRQ